MTRFTTSLSTTTLFLLCLSLSNAYKLGTIERADGSEYGPVRVKPLHDHEDQAGELWLGEQPANLASLPTPEAGKLADLESDNLGLSETGSGDSDTPDDEDLFNNRPNAQTKLPSTESKQPPLRDLSNIVGLMPRVVALDTDPSEIDDTEDLSELDDAEQSGFGDINTTVAVDTITEEPIIATQQQNAETVATTVAEEVDGDSTSTTNTTECLEHCTRLLHSSFTLQLRPNTTMLQELSTLSLSCSIETAGAEAAQLQWLFEGASEPRGECAIGSSSSTLRACDTFSSVTLHKVNSDTRVIHTLTVDALSTDNTGYFICQAVTYCCDGMQLHAQDKALIRVWRADYTSALLVLAGVAVSIALLLVVGGGVYRRRVQRDDYSKTGVSPSSVKEPSSLSYTVMPLQRSDSEDSFE